MHRKSIEYYNQNTDEFINRTICADMSFCQKKFTELLPPGSYILVAGCGSGRDSKLFIESGFRVLAMDASSQMCLAAAEYTS